MTTMAHIGVGNGKSTDETMSLSDAACKDQRDMLRAKLIQMLGAAKANAVISAHERKYRTIVQSMQPKQISNQIEGWIYGKAAGKCSAFKKENSPFGDRIVLIIFQQGQPTKLMFAKQGSDTFAEYKSVQSGSTLVFSGVAYNRDASEKRIQIGFNFTVDPNQRENSVTFTDQDPLTDQTVDVLSQFDSVQIGEQPRRQFGPPNETFRIGGLQAIYRHMTNFCKS
ncbi:hypothetical protein GS397_06995 [Sphingobium yanoikuyae]|uniref:Uncharacterized protein n=1 Tax=Sphingobium yanoikuyae TaxID=13690 RepID=A0A6P1GE84_SPHYA|nr:hypothetical protein [Sphingobium yanoikuyae]QHD66816.1 hypothetical protein GS397_06995 [Sphingobium yanoikuyae]